MVFTRVILLFWSIISRTLSSEDGGVEWFREVQGSLLNNSKTSVNCVLEVFFFFLDFNVRSGIHVYIIHIGYTFPMRHSAPCLSTAPVCLVQHLNYVLPRYPLCAERFPVKGFILSSRFGLSHTRVCRIYLYICHDTYNMCAPIVYIHEC